MQHDVREIPFIALMAVATVLAAILLPAQFIWPLWSRKPTDVPVECFGYQSARDTGDRRVERVCSAYLTPEMLAHEYAVRDCVTEIHLGKEYGPTPNQIAAFASLAYTVKDGIKAVCDKTRSRLAFLISKGYPDVACQQILRWDVATKWGVNWHPYGIRQRREDETMYCLQPWEARW